MKKYFMFEKVKDPSDNSTEVFIKDLIERKSPMIGKRFKLRADGIAYQIALRNGRPKMSESQFARYMLDCAKELKNA